MKKKGDYDATTKLAEAERRQFLRKRYSNRSKRSVIGTPPPVKGRRHEFIQTEQYLEELLIKPNDFSVECQTDLYLYEVPESTFIPSKNGIDAATEIDDIDLYDFDADVELIVNALAEMTIKQALDEFMQEEEMAELQRQKQQYLILKKPQNIKRLDNYQMQLNDETSIDEEVNAAKLLNQYVRTLLPDLLSSLNNEIRQKNIQQIDEKFKPWLANEIASEVGQMIDSRESLEKLVRNIVESRAEDYLQQENSK